MSSNNYDEFYPGTLDKDDPDYMPIVSHSFIEIKSKVLAEILKQDSFYKKFISRDDEDVFETDFNWDYTCAYPTEGIIKNLEGLLDILTKEFDHDYIHEEMLINNFITYGDVEISGSNKNKRLKTIRKIKENAAEIIQSIEYAEIWFFISAHDDDYDMYTDAGMRLYKTLIPTGDYEWSPLFDAEMAYKYEKGEDFWECLAHFQINDELIKVHEKSDNLKKSIIFGKRDPWAGSYS